MIYFMINVDMVLGGLYNNMYIFKGYFEKKLKN